jgi:CubicO group peptidase (beta-lactamase class C family)
MRILVATDGSRAGIAALKFGARLTRPGGQLIVLTVESNGEAASGRAPVARKVLGTRTLPSFTSRPLLSDIRVASPTLPRGYGFGLGFAVRKETGLNSMTGSAGEYRWGGAGGTAFWVDPKEQMVVVWMTQGQPGPMRGQDRDLFRQLVQAAILD